MSIRLNAYIVLDGRCREAIEFYTKALGATPVGPVITFGDMPADPNTPIPDEVKSRVGHAHLKVGDSDLMFSDTFPGMPHQVGDQVNIMIMSTDKAESARIFEALAEGGRVTMPLQETFWSPAYGSVVDRFGIPFQISTEPGR